MLGEPLGRHRRPFLVVDGPLQQLEVRQFVCVALERLDVVERVLNIFIRLNSGGTVLSYSDLLLSIAVAQWKQVDARAEIHKFVDELNRIGTGFALSQDFVSRLD